MESPGWLVIFENVDGQCVVIEQHAPNRAALLNFLATMTGHEGFCHLGCSIYLGDKWKVVSIIEAPKLINIPKQLQTFACDALEDGVS